MAGPLTRSVSEGVAGLFSLKFGISREEAQKLVLDLNASFGQPIENVGPPDAIVGLIQAADVLASPSTGARRVRKGGSRTVEVAKNMYNTLKTLPSKVADQVDGFLADVLEKMPGLFTPGRMATIVGMGLLTNPTPFAYLAKLSKEIVKVIPNETWGAIISRYPEVISALAELGITTANFATTPAGATFLTSVLYSYYVKQKGLNPKDIRSIMTAIANDTEEARQKATSTVGALTNTAKEVAVSIIGKIASGVTEWVESNKNAFKAGVAEAKAQKIRQTFDLLNQDIRAMRERDAAASALLALGRGRTRKHKQQRHRRTHRRLSKQKV